MQLTTNATMGKYHPRNLIFLAWPMLAYVPMGGMDVANLAAQHGMIPDWAVPYHK